MLERVVVVGLGYVGLPLADQCLLSGKQVVGVDSTEERVNQLNEGASYVDDISAAQIQGWLDLGFRAYLGIPPLDGPSVYVICVPTPLRDSHTPDLTYVEAAIRSVANSAVASSESPSLLILESTTYPGTTDEIVVPILEEAGFSPGSNIHVAYSPERIDPGNRNFHLRNTPKVVGGRTAKCLDLAVEFYSTIVDEVVPVSSLRTAEITKLLENTYRHVNIALANEFAMICRALSIDPWEAIDAASTKPFGFSPFYPGAGVGGHCIPIDPLYLSYRVRSALGEEFRLVETANEINRETPQMIAREVEAFLHDRQIALEGASISLLGITYKADIADTRETPATPLAHTLLDAGASLQFCDPFADEWLVNQRPIKKFALENLPLEMSKSDCLVVLQPHSQFVERGELILSGPTIDTCGLARRLRRHLP